jgi:hypothetical protein
MGNYFISNSYRIMFQWLIIELLNDFVTTVEADEIQNEH